MHETFSRLARELIDVSKDIDDAKDKDAVLLASMVLTGRSVRMRAQEALIDLSIKSGVTAVALRKIMRDVGRD